MLVRPSYVLGGRGMEIVYDEEGLARFGERALEISPGRPLLIDKFQLFRAVDEQHPPRCQAAWLPAR